MDWGQLQSIAFAVMAVTTIIAAAIVGALVGTNKTLRETVSDRGVRIEDLEKEVAREMSARATEVAREAAARVEAEAKSQVLASVVTGKVELVALGDLLDEHHREALKAWGLIGSDVKAIPERVAKVINQEKP